MTNRIIYEKKKKKEKTKSQKRGWDAKELSLGKKTPFVTKNTDAVQICAKFWDTQQISKGTQMKSFQQN